ncbi:Uncharacterised protein [Mycobacteroides abscessus subsp. abscessus]|nr:Uncharacterised protein [Mycobacteroides abscessus subsp. abscessus]
MLRASTPTATTGAASAGARPEILRASIFVSRPRMSVRKVPRHHTSNTSANTPAVIAIQRSAGSRR